MASVELVELDEPPKKNHIWAAVEVFAEGLELETNRPAHPRRELWYVPTVTIYDAHRADKLFQKYGIETVCDLGAGDCRFSLWCDRQGYDVIAYELNHELVEAVRNRFHLGDMELRERDFESDYQQLTGPNVAVVAFGGTNHLPNPPQEGLGIQGYGETGYKVWYNGERSAVW